MRQLLRDLLTVALAASAVALMAASIALMMRWLSSLGMVFGACLVASHGTAEVPLGVLERLARRWGGLG